MKHILNACLLGWFMGLGSQTLACATDTPCPVGDRNYYVATPESGDEGAPAIMFIHGFGSSGMGALRNARMVDAYTSRGYVVIAPDGNPREGRNGRSWGFHPRSGTQQADITFLENVRDDATARFNLDADRIVLAGFSIGGSMTAYTACNAPDSFAAYAPLGGNFWRPHPTECAGPVKMLHTHGWSDGTVPLEGRVVNRVDRDDPAAFAQGDVTYAMSLWRDTNGCATYQPRQFDTNSPFWQRTWTDCMPGAALTFALFDGGHTIPPGWPDLVADWVAVQTED